ncbi:MAG: ABC transporter ATP-binding protein [bacterium JZ-2024 1]
MSENHSSLRPDVTSQPSSRDGRVIVDLRDIKKEYFLGTIVVPVLHGITLRVRQGEYVAIMGPSGSGKSTLMHIIGLLDVPTAGSYYLDGTRVDTLSDNALSRQRNRKIGFVFQAHNLLPQLTALRNVELPLAYAGIPTHERRRRALEALARVALSDRVNHRPTELSGGQAQRVAVARALVTQPELILADEPTGNLDSKSEAQILNLMDEIHDSGNTLIIVTHSRQVAERAQRILHILDGLIAREEVLR